jgi:hypothetical protein
MRRAEANKAVGDGGDERAALQGRAKVARIRKREVALGALSIAAIEGRKERSDAALGCCITGHAVGRERHDGADLGPQDRVRGEAGGCEEL